jgi:phosphoglycerate dehydrogenase-like enzyme
MPGFRLSFHFHPHECENAVKLTKVLIGPQPMRHLEHIWAPPLRAAGLEPVLPIYTSALMTEDQTIEQLQGCIASLAGSEPYTRKVLTAAKAGGLKILARAGVGYDSVDVAAATELGIVVGYGPGSNHEAVAEHAMMFLLAQAKNLFVQHAGMQQGTWPRKATIPVRGKTLGIVGLGRVGKAVALRAKPFNLNIIATEPFPDRAFIAAQGIKLVPLDELLSTADWVSLHCPLLPETRHLMNAKTLARMKPSAFLINTARGEVVEQAAVVAALEAKQIAGAAFDVFEVEPTKADNPLTKFGNVMMTAHTAGVDKGSQDTMALFAAECIADFLSGKWPGERVVNPEVRNRVIY